MKNMKKALIRGMIPLAVMGGIALIMKTQKMDDFQVRSTLLTGIIIACVAAASVIYDIDGWSLKKQSAVHFVAMLLTVFPCLLLSGWFPLNSVTDYPVVFGVFIGFGIVLWTISYLVFGKRLGKKAP